MYKYVFYIVFDRLYVQFTSNGCNNCFSRACLAEDLVGSG